MSPPSWIGHTLHGRYKIESLLGSGGMATRWADWRNLHFSGQASGTIFALNTI